MYVNYHHSSDVRGCGVVWRGRGGVRASGVEEVAAIRGEHLAGGLAIREEHLRTVRGRTTSG